MIPKELLYTDQHEWVKVDGNIATVGITDHAQNALGDLTFVELPPAGNEYAKGDEVSPIESCKAAASIYAPAGGKIVEGNSAVEDDPALLNSDCYGAGWIYKIELSNPDELQGLMNAEQYTEFEGQEA